MKSFLSPHLAVLAWLLTSAAYAAEAPVELHDAMQRMQAKMDAIHAEHDTGRRAELMREHHAMMQHGMDMTATDDTAALPLEERVTRLEARVDMMRMMMDHMMEMGSAQGADDAAAEHDHGD